MSEENKAEETTEVKPMVYFGTKKTGRYYFPDGVQWIEVKTLNEGEKSAYEDSVARPLSMNKQADQISMTISPGSDRKHLIKYAVVKYSVYVQSDSGDVERMESSDITHFVKDLYPNMESNCASDLYDKIAELNPWIKKSNKEEEKKG